MYTLVSKKDFSVNSLMDLISKFNNSEYMEYIHSVKKIEDFTVFIAKEMKLNNNIIEKNTEFEVVYLETEECGCVEEVDSVYVDNETVTYIELRNSLTGEEVAISNLRNLSDYFDLKENIG